MGSKTINEQRKRAKIHCANEGFCHEYIVGLMNYIPNGWGCPFTCDHDTRTNIQPDALALFEEIEAGTKHRCQVCRELQWDNRLIWSLESLLDWVRKNHADQTDIRDHIDLELGKYRNELETRQLKEIGPEFTKAFDEELAAIEGYFLAKIKGEESPKRMLQAYKSSESVIRAMYCDALSQRPCNQGGPDDKAYDANFLIAPEPTGNYMLYVNFEANGFSLEVTKGQLEQLSRQLIEFFKILQDSHQQDKSETPLKKETSP